MPPKIALILADGRSKDKHIDNPYSLKVPYRPLLRRTVQQFAKHMPVVVLTSREDVRELLKGQKNMSFYEPKARYDHMPGVAMILKALDRAWSPETLVVFGDVYFTEEAVNTIVTSKPLGWAVYGRSTDNPYTGTPWAEFFAFATSWGAREDMRQAAHNVFRTFVDGGWLRASPWEWYFHMEGLPYWIEDVANVQTGNHWVEINDITDDIDFQKDADNLNRVLMRK